MHRKSIITVLGLSALLITSTSFSFAQAYPSNGSSSAFPKMKRELKLNPNRSNPNPSQPMRPDPTFGLTKAIDQLSNLSVKLETRISSASAAGKDVTALNTLLTDMNNKIADAKSQEANNAVTATPSAGSTASNSGMHRMFRVPRAWMSTARNDLRQALQDAIKIIRGLKALDKNANPSTTVTKSPIDTITPTDTPTPSI